MHNRQLSTFRVKHILFSSKLPKSDLEQNLISQLQVRILPITEVGQRTGQKLLNSALKLKPNTDSEENHLVTDFIDARL